MNVKIMIAVVCAAVLTAGAAAVLLIGSNDNDGGAGGREYTASVWLDGVPEPYTGKGQTVRGIIEDALGGDHDVTFGSGGQVVSVDGIGNTAAKTWAVFRWASPNGWAVLSGTASGYADGMTIAVHHADRTVKEGVTSYSVPDIDVTYRVYFFIQFREMQSTPLIEILKKSITEGEMRDGIWIEGTGSTVNEALADAVLRYFFPDNEYKVSEATDETENADYRTYSVIADGDELVLFSYGMKPAMYGWFLSFFGWSDTKVGGGGEYGTWTYWSQYSYHPDASTTDDPAHWGYNQFAFGLYDITKYHYFALILQTTEAEDDVFTAIPAPSGIPGWLLSEGS